MAEIIAHVSYIRVTYFLRLIPTYDQSDWNENRTVINYISPSIISNFVDFSYIRVLYIIREINVHYLTSIFTYEFGI